MFCMHALVESRSEAGLCTTFLCDIWNGVFISGSVMFGCDMESERQCNMNTILLNHFPPRVFRFPCFPRIYTVFFPQLRFNVLKSNDFPTIDSPIRLQDELQRLRTAHGVELEQTVAERASHSSGRMEGFENILQCWSWSCSHQGGWPPIIIWLPPLHPLCGPKKTSALCGVGRSQLAGGGGRLGSNKDPQPPNPTPNPF